MALAFTFASNNSSTGLFSSMNFDNDFSDNNSNNNMDSASNIFDGSSLFSSNDSSFGFDTFISSNSAETAGNIASFDMGSVMIASAGVETAGSAGFSCGDIGASIGGDSAGASCGDGGGFIG